MALFVSVVVRLLTTPSTVKKVLKNEVVCWSNLGPLLVCNPKI